ncbi:hypothetical protein H6F75_05445 [Nodosilinea sp. FACHB-131]|uniref:DUF6325 family protein n=1 Tax=Cyanophyceae TaxID=3028117 RepID=UPI001682D341|nr:DUF6325 family protein [Nodosilinea sp. FACHB-131]MBD1872917.1 hypothetical protein [Nodosilinea sp. FACHB-131]
MPLGPIEILSIKFPERAVTAGIAAALKTLVDSQMIRIVDILFVKKNGSGDVTLTEIDEMDDIDHSLLDPLIADISGLISEEDVQAIAQGLDNNSFAALMLFENTWATSFRDAVLKADGQLILSERIPSRIVDEALAAQAAE